MKILVTGATGFIGTHLVKRLSDLGHTVFPLVRNINKAKYKDLAGPFIRGSLNELSWINQLPSDLDAVIHTAGLVHSYKTMDFYRNNFDYTGQLIEGLKERFPQLKFLLVSSLAAAGPADCLVEEDEDRPVSHYGRSKLLAEEKLKIFAPKKWERSIIRPPMVIGPGDTAVLDIFKMVSDGVMLVPGMRGLENQYSFVCVNDLVEVIVRCLDKTVLDIETYYAVFDKSCTFSELIHGIKKSMQKERLLIISAPLFIIKAFVQILKILSLVFPVKFRLTPDKYKEMVPSSWRCSGEKSKRDLNMQYQWPLEQTIDLTLQDYLQRGWIKSAKPQSDQALSGI